MHMRLANRTVFVENCFWYFSNNRKDGKVHIGSKFQNDYSTHLPRVDRNLRSRGLQTNLSTLPTLNPEAGAKHANSCTSGNDKIRDLIYQM